MNRSRLARVISNMEREGLACILVSAPHSVYYLTGKFIHPGERMLALMVKKSGEVRLFANRLFALTEEEGLPLTDFDDTENSVKVLAEHLPTGRVGIDKLWPSEFTIRLIEARSDIVPVLGSGPVDDARMVKDQDEIALLRASSRLNDEALSRLIPTLKIGDTEAEVCERFKKISAELGCDGGSQWELVCFGPNSAQPHHSSDNTLLEGGQAVILDVGFLRERYMSDMTRTVHMGPAPDEFKRVYEIVKRANAAGRAAARPGIPMREIDFAARKVIEDAGYGKYFIHRTGHGIGLEVHEPMDASSVNGRLARAGMAFSVEPGIYLPGKFGVRIEDIVCLTEDGAETLNRMDRELIEL